MQRKAQRKSTFVTYDIFHYQKRCFKLSSLERSQHCCVIFALIMKEQNTSLKKIFNCCVTQNGFEFRQYKYDLQLATTASNNFENPKQIEEHFFFRIAIQYFFFKMVLSRRIRSSIKLTDQIVFKYLRDGINFACMLSGSKVGPLLNPKWKQVPLFNYFTKRGKDLLKI